MSRKSLLKTDYHVIAEADNIRIITIDDRDTVIEFTRNGGYYHDLLTAIKEVVAIQRGHSTSNRLGAKFACEEIYAVWPAIKEKMENEYDTAIPNPIVTFFDEKTEQHRKQLQDNIDRGVIEFFDIPAVFKVGSEVIALRNGKHVGGVVKSVGFQSSFSGVFAVFAIEVINDLSGFVADTVYQAQVRMFDGVVPMKSLSVRFITETEKVILSKRGENFRKWANKSSYLQYTGQIVEPSWWSPRSYRADGRVMVDVRTLGQVKNDTFSMLARSARVEQANRDLSSAEYIITDDNLWRCWPWLAGFSFNAKKWGEMELDGLSEIAWRQDAWDLLVLPDREKELVKSLVEHHGESFSDIVDEKGGGAILMLYGPPGEGKTLTMETIAELLQKPLYRVSVGELGVSPDQLEERLQEILDIATTWDAVVGLDEADIFLAKRDKDNILRNAMVGVFLRLTEYHQGVLFLTTNMVDQIDEAFESRISVTIGFKPGTREKRQKIWTNLLHAAQIEEGVLDPVELSKIELNGRQIKNVIRQSQTLAKARGVKLTPSLVSQVVAVTKRDKAGPLRRAFNKIFQK